MSSHGRSTDNDSTHRHNNKKRKHHEDGDSRRLFNEMGLGLDLGEATSLLHQPDLPAFNLTSARHSSQDAGSPKYDEGWQTIENGRPTKKAKKIPKKTGNNYPEIHFSRESRLQSQIKISDLQNLVLYLLADGTAPQFVSVRHRNEIRKVVVLMVPGLEQSMFELEKPSQDPDYYPQRLKTERLPDNLQSFADMFDHLWPAKAPGDDKWAKMHSPFHAMLTAPGPQKSNREKKNEKRGKGAAQAKEPAGWTDTRTPVTEFLQTPDELLENEYTLHPAMFNKGDEKIDLQEQRVRSKTSNGDGWVDTSIENFEDGSAPDNEIEAGSLTAGREVLAMDCEMCLTGERESALTRISIVGWDGSVVLDELVKPEKPITDYLTQYSGITEKKLEGVTTTVEDIQKKLVEILNPRTILIGHSLNSDLTCLKLTHPFIIDTALLYPHPRGPPLKSSLKWLAQKYLNREIQKGHGTTGPGAGHDSIEDARTCLDLLKQKCEKGKEWGTSDAAGENLFKRIARSGVKYKNQGGTAIPSPMNARSSAAVDWGNPKLGAGNAATFPIGCKSDEEVTEGIIRAVKGDSDGLEIPGGGVDFVFGRLRELEALKGWWNNNKTIAAEAAAKGKAMIADVELPNVIPFEPSKEVGEAAIAPAEATPSEAIPAKTTAAEVPASTDIMSNLAETLSTPAAETPIITNSLPPPVTLSPDTTISSATATLTSRLYKIYESLPPCTAFIIYSGSGDPREMSRLQTMQATFKREYKIKKWDQLSVKWTDTEEQALRRAVKEARQGIAFMCVK